MDYLNELIYEFDTRRFLAIEVEFHLLRTGGPSQLRAVLKGEIFDPSRHVLKTEVKAATFHGIDVRRTPDAVEADVIFDL